MKIKIIMLFFFLFNVFICSSPLFHRHLASVLGCESSPTWNPSDGMNIWQNQKPSCGFRAAIPSAANPARWLWFSKKYGPWRRSAARFRIVPGADHLTDAPQDGRRNQIKRSCRFFIK
jgi:hypothetical protein